MKRVIYILLLIACCGAIGKGVHLARDGFTLRRVTAPISVGIIRWNEEANLAIGQSFRYLGRGRQCFAFESFDGKYVLKLPRTDIYQVPFRIRAIPIFLNKNEAIARQEREKFVLESMRIAFDELQDETGVFGLHFGHTADLGQRIQLIDALGYSYQLPQHKTSFVLQKKQPILMKCFSSTQDASKKEKILNAFINLVVARGKKGIWNKDESFLKNYGFDGQRGYQIDIGSFYHKQNSIASIRDTLHPVRTWLKKNDPTMLPYFENTLERKLLNL